MIFAQLLVNSLVIGSVYALVAAGFSLIYKTNRFFHFAHGTVVIFSGYLFFFFFSSLNINFFTSCTFTLLLSCFIGYGFYEGIYRPMKLRGSSNAILLIVSVALMIFLDNLLLMLFGPSVKIIKVEKISESFSLFGAFVTPLQIIIVGVSLLLFVLLFLFINRTKIGRDMRAVADSMELSDVVGIDSRRILNMSFILGSFIAGVAGILASLELNLTPYMGASIAVKGFTGAVVGGIMNVPASILGSFVLGLVENFGTWYLPSGYKDAVAFFLLFLFLLFKPEGLFGKKKEGDR